MKYTVDYFIGKFTAIPEELWWEGDYQNPLNSAQHCALGHCGARLKILPNSLYKYGTEKTDESEALVELFESTWTHFNKHPMWDITIINDCDRTLVSLRSPPKALCAILTLPTPKQRILAALLHIKRLTQ